MSDVSMVRERECRAAEEFITRAGAGPAGLLIDGEPGIGKTTVWLDAVRRAGVAGFAVMSTRGAAAEARLSHAGLTDLQPDSGGAAFRATAVAAAIAGRTGDLERGRRDMAVVQQRFVDRGSETDIMWAASHAVLFDVWLGRYRDASHTAREALQRAEQMGGRHPRVMALTGVAAVAAYTGNTDDARAAAREAIAAAHLLGAAFMTIAPLSSVAFVEASLGRYAEALAAIEPLLTAFDPDHDTEIWVGAWLPDAIEALCALGRVDEADPLVDALLTNGSRLGRPWIQAVGWRGRASCLAARRDVVGAQSAAEAALLEHERLPMPFEKARTQLLLGQLRRRRRQRLAAVATVTEALTTFDSLGSPVWSARAKAELQRLNGAWPRISDSRLPSSALPCARRRVFRTNRSRRSSSCR